MSNYAGEAYNPRTGALEIAMFLDNHFGPHCYGIKFTDGQIYPENLVRVPGRLVSDPEPQATP